MRENCHSNFIITGHGRSGTKFLSTVMNLSEKWTVLHEPDPKGLDAPIEDVQSRLNQDFYGEVNSYLRSKLFDLRVDKKGVIFRDIFQVWISIANKCKEEMWQTKLLELTDTMKTLDRAIGKDIRFIDFEKMVSSRTYLQKTIAWFGITDVDLSEKDMAPVNSTMIKKYKTMSDFPKRIQKEVSVLESYFTKKFKRRP